MVAHPDPELQALIERFVCVRLIQMGGVDLAVFQFDPFLSWSLFFMNGDKTIYGRFGRAHPNSKMGKKDSNPNHTLDGMKAALRKALEIHKGYAKKPEEWRLALAGKTGPEPRWSFAEKTPAALKYKRMKRIEPGESELTCGIRAELDQERSRRRTSQVVASSAAIPARSAESRARDSSETSGGPARRT